MQKEIIVLGNWEKAKLAISECKSIDELKIIKDKAEALRAYAKQAKESLEVQNNVAEIKIRCERKIGEFSKELPVNKQFSKATSHDGKSFKTDILKEAGIQHYERYESIANLPEKDFENYIIDVKKSNEELTSVGILREARKLNITEKKEIPLPEGKYNVIYADPCWKYDNSGISGAAENHYPTMETEEICKLEVPSADNSVLFLWATNPFLKEGIQVCERWGFTYKTNIVWIKEKAGQGFYVKGQHELLLIAIKGNFRPDDSLYIRSVVEAKREKHSQKPELFYEIIEKMYPNEKYIELFSRNKRNGWIMWGLEAPK